MAQVELNIVALGDFSSVNAQIKSLQEQVLLLQKNMAGVGVSSNFAKELTSVNAAFRQTMLSTGQFTAATVKMTSETEKFGQALVTGKLKLTEYYNIIKQKNSEAVTQMKALAVEQTKLQNSIVMNDPSKQGILSVYTPTQIDKVANATKIAAHEANLYAIAVKKGSEQLITWGKNTQWAGRQLTVGMSVPLMIFGQQATKVFTDVNNELVRLQKVYGTGLVQPSKQALDAIKSQVTGLARELASTMGVAAKDTAAMAADLAATGKTGNDLLVATREAMRLSKLGELDTQAAMKATVSLQNVYKLSTQQLSGAIDFLNAVENQTSTSLQDLVDGIPRVGPIVQQLGGSFKDTAVMMVAMKEAGVPAAQSANAIKSAIASLINPTVGAQKAFAAFHINLKDIATSTGGNPIKMIMELQTALKGLQPLAQAQLIEKLFGKFQQARIQALITNLGANNSQTKTAFDLMNANSQQLAAVAAGEMKTSTESVTGKYQRTLQTFKANLIPVGQELVKIATKLLDFGNSVSKVFSGLPGPLKSVMGAIAIGIAISGPIIMLTGLFANFAGYVLKGFFNLKQLATGGKTLGQLLTPELIAAENASKLFQSGIAGDVEAVNLLSKAIKDLTLSIESMVGSISTGTGIGRVLQNVATTARAAEQMPLPGFATGKMPSGVVPGSGSGKVDTFPAMLAPGELVVDTETTKKYWPLLSRIVTGKVPGYHEGNYYDAKGNLQELGPHSHTESSQIDKKSKERITEQSGNAVYVGPQAGNEGSGSIPSVLSGLAGYISRISGLGNKLEKEVTPAVNALAQELEFDPMNPNSQRAQISMMHFSPNRTVLPGDDPNKGTRKVWDFPDMAAGSQGDNQLSVYFDATKSTGKKIRPYLMEQAEKARAAMVAEITDPKTGILNENDRKEALRAIEEGFATVTSGGAAITREAVDLTHRVTDLVVQDIKNKSDKLPEQIVTPEKYDKSGNIKSKRQLTGAGYDVLWANETTRRQLSGELPAPSDLTADKWMKEADISKHPTPAALKDRKELPFVPLMGANANVRETGGQYNFSELTPQQVAIHQKALDQFIAIEVKAGRTGTQEFKALQDAYKNAMQEFNTQAKAIESEIESIQQRILSEGPNMAAKQLDKLKIQLEEQQTALASIGQVMSNGFATGIIDGIPEVEASARRLAQSAITSVARTQKSASKSKVTEQLGFDFGGGYDYGILSTVPQTIIAGETLGKSGIQGLEQGVGIGNSSTMLGRITSKIPFMGKTMPRSGMMNFGLSTAMMMGGQMLSGMLPKGSNASGLLSGASSGASLGMFIPGVGPIAGAAVGAAIAGIKQLIQATKEQEAQTKATWQSSTSAATFYNRATIDTVNHLKDIKYEETGLFKPVADLANQYKQVNVQLDKFTAMVKSLPSNDPLSLLIKNIKETSDSNAAGKLAQDFVNIQSAIGQIDSAKAKDLVNLILTAGEKGALVGSVNTAKSQIDAVISVLNASSTAGTFGTVLQQIAAAAQNTTSLTTFKNIISGIQQSSANSSAGIDSFRASLTNLSDQTLVTKLAAMGYKLADILKIFMLVQSGATVNVAGGPAKTIEAINKQIDAQFAKINAATAPLKAQQTATQGQLDNTNNQIKALEKKKAVIDKQLKTQRDISTEMQRQHDYTVSQIDLQNKQKDALIHGDYLSAATIGQQKDYATMQFNQQTKAVGLQGQSDLLGQKIADLQASASSLSSSITTLGNKIQTLSDTIAKTPLKPGGGVTGVDSGNLGITPYYPRPNEPGYNPAGLPIFKDAYGNTVDAATASTMPVNAPKGVNPKGTHNPIEKAGIHSAFSRVPTDLKGRYPYTDPATGLIYTVNGLVLDKSGKKIISQWFRSPEGDTSGNTVIAFADGGHIKGPGTGTSDSIPAYLSNGEYVVKADAVSHYGTGFFDSVNAKKFSGGGLSVPFLNKIPKIAASAALWQAMEEGEKALSLKWGANENASGISKWGRGLGRVAYDSLQGGVSGVPWGGTGFIGGSIAGLVEGLAGLIKDGSQFGIKGGSYSTDKGFDAKKELAKMNALDSLKNVAISAGMSVPFSFAGNMLSPLLKKISHPVIDAMKNFAAVKNIKEAKNWVHYAKQPITEVLPSIGRKSNAEANYGIGTYGSISPDMFKGKQFGEEAHKLSLSPFALIKTAFGKGSITDSQLAKEAKEFNKLTGTKISGSALYLNNEEFVSFLSKKGYSGYKNNDIITNWKIGSSGFGLKNNLGKIPFADHLNTKKFGVGGLAVWNAVEHSFLFKNLIKSLFNNKEHIGIDLKNNKELQKALNIIDNKENVETKYKVGVAENLPSGLSGFYDKKYDTELKQWIGKVVVSKDRNTQTLLHEFMHHKDLGNIGTSSSLFYKKIMDPKNSSLTTKYLKDQIDSVFKNAKNASALDKNIYGLIHDNPALVGYFQGLKEGTATDMASQFVKQNPKYLKTFGDPYSLNRNYYSNFAQLLQDDRAVMRSVPALAGLKDAMPNAPKGVTNRITNWMNKLQEYGISANTKTTDANFIDLLLWSKKNPGFYLGGQVKLPSFAVGTDYVPRDMIAQIHKGERIIPASENNGTMGHTFNINIDGARYTDPDKLAKTITDTVIAKLNVNSSKVNVTNRVGRN
jgi:TP901 family phage tail tape measure protein